MKNNNVLNFRELHNHGIDSIDCKNCVYNWENGCPSDQSPCWICHNKSEFKPMISFDSFGSLESINESQVSEPFVIVLNFNF